jgi:hypothetical protein
VGVVLALAVGVAGCQAGGGDSSETEARDVPQRVASPALGVALADLPEGVEVISADASAVRLTAADGVSGEIVLDVTTPESGGVNLVAAVQEHQAELEARPDGTYHGSQELRTQLGPAFTSRGAYTGDGGAVQELHVYSLHPEGDAMLRLRTEYPAAEDASARAQTLLELLAQVEGLTPGDGAAEAP